MKGTYQKQLDSGTKVRDAAYRHQRHRGGTQMGGFLRLCAGAGQFADRAETPRIITISGTFIC